MKFLNCRFLYVFMMLFMSLTIASCSDENEAPLSGETESQLSSSEEIISNIFSGLSSLVDNGKLPEKESVMAYLKKHWGDLKIEERDSIIFLSLEDSLTLQLDIYGTSVVGVSNWELDTLSLAHSLDSISKVLGRNISDSITTINTDSIFSEEDLGSAKSRVVGNTFLTRAASTKENTILVNNNILVWAPWYETESEYERSHIYKTMNDLVNTINKRRPQYLHLSPIHCNGSRLADLGSMSRFKDYDIVFIDCHGTKNGEIVMPITAETKKLTKDRVGIWDINKGKFVEGVVLNEYNMARFLPKKLDHTILFTAMCYAYPTQTRQSLFYRIATNRNVADFMGATNSVTIKTPLENFVEFAKTFLTGGIPTTLAFKNQSYTDSYNREGKIIRTSGNYLHARNLSDVFYSYARPLPYNQKTGALRGRMPMPQNLVSQQRVRNFNSLTRSITSNLGSSPQSGFYLKDLKRGKTKMIPLNENNVTSYHLFPCGNNMADVEYEVKIGELEPGDYVYCTYLWNGETLIVSKTSQRFSIEDENVEAYAVLKNGILTLYYDRNKNLYDERSSRIFSISHDYHPNTDSYNRNEDYPFAGADNVTTNVVFDASFANYKPQKTTRWFQGFKNLRSVKDICYLNTADVTDMWGMFCECSSLAELDLSSFATANVTNMGMMFYSCNSLVKIDVSGFDTSNVTEMSHMFADCSSLTSLDLTNFNMSNIQRIDCMFINCKSLRKIYAGNWNIAPDISYYMFLDCDNLVGGKGTTLHDIWYHDNCEEGMPYDGRVAHIDGGKDNPGLFTAK